jgi:hypothetical protein
MRRIITTADKEFISGNGGAKEIRQKDLSNPEPMK